MSEVSVEVEMVTYVIEVSQEAVAKTVEIVFSGFGGTPGSNGVDGQDGADGQDAENPNFTVSTGAPGTDVEISGTYPNLNIQIPEGLPGATVGSGVSVDNTNLVTLDGNNVQSLFEQTDQALLNARSTGIIYGGDLTVNGNTFSVSAGRGQILNIFDPLNPSYTEVEWTAKTNVTPSLTGIVYLYFDSNDNTLKQSNTAPTYVLRGTRLYIGRVIYNGGVIQGFAQDKDYAQQMGLQLRALADAIGLMRITASGLLVTANGANLSLSYTAGDLFDFGVNGLTDPHEIAMPGATAFTFQYLTRSTTIATNRTTIDPDNYNPSGTTVSAVSNNRWTIQDIILFPTGNIRIQYGQNQYNSSAEAVEAIRNRLYERNPATSLGFRMAFLIVQKGATDLSNTAQATIRNANKFGE